MTIEFTRIGRARTIAVVLPVVLIVSGVIAYAFLPPLLFSSAAPPDLAYFQGKWNLTIKSEPETSYTWTVTDGLKGAWLDGILEKNTESVSRDLWRANAGVIERYVFTSDGSFIKLVSSGWKSGKMVLNGISYGKAADSRVRETITRESERRFRSVWERQGDDGIWVVFADETCSK